MRAAIAILLCFTFSIPAFAQNDRRDRQEPELVIEPGGRTGTCDALIFSDDGKLLFAVGDDKVVGRRHGRGGRRGPRGLMGGE